MWEWERTDYKNFVEFSITHSERYNTLHRIFLHLEKRGIAVQIWDKGQFGATKGAKLAKSALEIDFNKRAEERDGEACLYC